MANDFSFNEYQEVARKTAIYPMREKLTYPILGLVGEAGEVANKYKKVLRDNNEKELQAIPSELGDVLWYLANICSDLGITLEAIALDNIHKLLDRKERGVLGGSGDNR